MSISKAFYVNNWWSFSLACTLIFSNGALVQNSGISSISAHCTNAANKHFSFDRNFSQTHLLVAEQTLTAYVEKGHDARFTLYLDKSAPISITILSNRPNEIGHQLLFFNETVNLTKYLKPNSSSIHIPCALSGRYDVLILSTGNVQIKMDFSQRQPLMGQQRSHYFQTSRIRYENRIQKRQVLFKWDKSKLDIHVMEYCLAINVHKNENTLCDAVDQIMGLSPKLFCSRLKAINNYFMRPAERVVQIDSKRGNALACTGRQNKQILQGLLPNKKYFVDLFAVHKKNDGLTFKLGSTTIIFNRSNPIALQEDHIEVGKLTEFDKRSVFTFKIPQNRLRDPFDVQFLIIPCGFALKVKIFNQKKLKKVLDIDRSTLIKFNNTKVNDRFLLKFKPSNLDDSVQNSNFKLIATTKDHFQTFPMLPSDTLVEEIQSLSTCKASTIKWRSSPDLRNIKYCVTVTKLKPKHSEDTITTINSCDIEKPSSRIFLATKHDCLQPSNHSSPMERFQITGLSPGHGYAIQLKVKLGNQSLPYRTIRIFKSHHCFVPILMTQNQLPKTTKTHSTSNRSKVISTQQYEDNNILVP